MHDGEQGEPDTKQERHVGVQPPSSTAVRRYGYEDTTNVLFWPGVWAVTSTALIVGMSTNVSFNRLDESGNLLLGAASGCLSSTWVFAGTWIGLSGRPKFGSVQTTSLSQRCLSTIPWIVNFVVLIAGTWYDRSAETQNILMQLFLATAIAITGPIILWQWTRQRIHLGQALPHQSQSIRQILGIVLTLALAIGALRMGQRGFGVNSAATGLIVSISLNWGLMSVAMLGKRGWIALLVLVLLIPEWITVSSLVDLRERSADEQISYFGGMLMSSCIFSFLFLAQIRADGYRWLTLNRT